MMDSLHLYNISRMRFITLLVTQKVKEYDDI